MTGVEERLWVGAEAELSEIVPMLGGTSEAVVCSTARPGGGRNEDAVLALDLGDGRAVLAIADGMGGAPQGDLAARTALRKLADACRNGGSDLRAAALHGIDAADRAIRSETQGGGATLALVLLEGRTGRSLHVGDAAVLVCGQRGRIKHVTVSHSPVGYALEAGVLTEQEAMLHDARHLVSNALGFDPLRVEVGAPMRLADRDTVVVGSDGLFDNLRIEEIVEIVRRGSLRTVAADLRDAVARRMAGDTAPAKPDDCAFVLYRPRRSGGKRAA